MSNPTQQAMKCAEALTDKWVIGEMDMGEFQKHAEVSSVASIIDAHYPPSMESELAEALRKILKCEQLDLKSISVETGYSMDDAFEVFEGAMQTLARFTERNTN